MRVMRVFGAALLAGIALDARAVTADYAREDRLAAEIVPAIVVGDPVYLATPRRPRVLAIYTAPPREPVLDVVAQNDRPEVLKAASARADSLPRDSCSRQVTIPGTDHFMANRRKELAEAVARFLQAASAGSCRR